VSVLDTCLLLSVDAEENRFRFFAIELRARDDGAAEIRRRWGRVGTDGRVDVEVFEDEAQARIAWDALVRRRERRGYVAAATADLRTARRLLAWHRSRRLSPRQLAFPVAAGF